jgi:predicted patatin/cPLA2 family phospholipase
MNSKACSLERSSWEKDRFILLILFMIFTTNIYYLCNLKWIRKINIVNESWIFDATAEKIWAIGYE